MTPEELEEMKEEINKVFHSIDFKKIVKEVLEKK